MYLTEPQPDVATDLTASQTGTVTLDQLRKIIALETSALSRTWSLLRRSRYSCTGCWRGFCQHHSSGSMAAIALAQQDSMLILWKNGSTTCSAGKTWSKFVAQICPEHLHIVTPKKEKKENSAFWGDLAACMAAGHVVASVAGAAYCQGCWTLMLIYTESDNMYETTYAAL